MNYNVVIVEDESHQQERLLSLLKESCNNLHILGVAPDLEAAYTLIQRTSPDLVFLDVMLPPHTGFELLQRFDPIEFDIIFTTSFEEFAVKAFRLSAIDYLVKPLVSEELCQAVEKFIARRRNDEGQRNLSVLMENLQVRNVRQKKIALPTLSGYTFVAVEEIIRCKADNTYTTFFLRDKRKIVISKTLKECENMLSDFSFFRVHHSDLINLEYIVAYEKGEGGVVKMMDGSSVDVSRRKKDEFVRLFKKSASEKP
jgi:two-component system LytT family response regulator